MGPRFEELFLPHLDAAYGLARFIARDAAAADDIVQESFLRALRSFGTYRGGDTRSWLLAIVRNCCFDWSRSVRGAQSAGTDAELESLPDECSDGPETSVVRRGEIDEVRAMIQRLPEPFRETLVLRELEELSYKEIAQITGVPMGTVMSRLARARNLLTRDLEQRR